MKQVAQKRPANKPKIRMRYLRFSDIKGQINAERVAVLERKYRVRHELAHTLEGENVSEPADLLRIEAFLQLARPIELWRFLANLNEPVSPPKRVRDYQSYFNTYSGTVFGWRKYTEDEIVYFIADDQGDVISAPWHDVARRFDYATVRICGYFTWEITRLPTQQLETLHQRLLARPSVLAGLVWYEHLIKDLPESNRTQIATLSQLLRSIQGFIAPRQALVEPSVTDDGNVRPPTDTPPDSPADGSQGPCPWDPKYEDGVNGCTCVPDFNFKECCDAHDRCYGEGCSECDRLECDIALYDCILQKTGLPELAWLYFTGVRVLSSFRFNYCGNDNVPPVVIATGGLVGTGIGVASSVVFNANATLPFAVGGLLVGLVAATDMMARVQQFLGRRLCGVCDTGIELEKVCSEQVERLRQEIRKQYEERKRRCRRRRRWWQRLFCRIAATILYAFEVFWVEAFHLVCRMASAALQLTCLI